MLNPSKADATVDDPTIRRCIHFAKRRGSEGLIVVNLFAARSTDPDALWKMDDPEGPENHAYVAHACELAAQHEPTDESSGRMYVPGIVVCAWGTHPVAENQRSTVMGWVDASGTEAYCLGLTKMGHPKHPLYIKGDTEFVRYRG